MDTFMRLSKEDHQDMKLMVAYSEEVTTLKDGVHWLLEYLRRHSQGEGETGEESMARELDQFVKRHRRK